MSIRAKFSLGATALSAGCISSDIDGNIRTADAPCDAGADEIS